MEKVEYYIETCSAGIYGIPTWYEEKSLGSTVTFPDLDSAKEYASMHCNGMFRIIEHKESFLSVYREGYYTGE